LPLRNEDVDEIGDTENEEDTDGPDEVEEVDEIYAADDRDDGKFRYRTDAEKKKERRQERAMLDKEGKNV